MMEQKFTLLTPEALEALISKYCLKYTRQASNEILQFLKENPNYFNGSTSHENELLDTKGVASLLKISRTTIANWRKKGLLKAHRKSGRIYFLKSEILSFKQ